MDNKMMFEHKFSELFNQDNADGCSVHFEYVRNNESLIDAIFYMAEHKLKLGLDSVTLTVKTFNPKKNIGFTLIVVNEKTDLLAIESAYNEFVSMRQADSKEFSSYTLEWKRVEDPAVIRSYFYAKDEYDVLDKFYTEVNKNNVVFYSLKVNPIS